MENTMVQENTTRKLADMSDEGAFERLATAILRNWDHRYRSLSHPGVNADGKTVKSPVDGIAFVPGADPPHMIAVHHTSCAAKDLKKKWLHDPAKVKSRKRRKLSAAHAGDVVKTIRIIEEEKKRTPNLESTLILTTNREPGESLVRDAYAVCAAAGVTLDIWACSRLVDVLDNEPRGQWLRRQFLGIEQVRLSEEMLNELSKKSLELHRPLDRSEAWVERAFDNTIAEPDEERIMFVIAESGSGKSVACHKRLLANMLAGGFSLVLTDEVIGTSLTLEQAIEKTLTQLNPSLMVGCGGAALKISTPTRRLLFAVEDVSRSGRGAALIEKIARWDNGKSKGDEASSWQLLCPVWPQVMSSLSEETRRQISSQAVIGDVFSTEEGTKAVELRGKLNGRSLTKLEAARISESLGHDPLLIALHDPANAPDASQTIAQFVEASLQKLAATKGEFSAAEYGKALSDLAKTMLLGRQLEPYWLDLLAWRALTEHASALRHIVHQGDVVRLVGPSTNEKLAFRHDRVREWMLAKAAFDLLHTNTMPEEIAAEPYFAEVFGLALVREDISASDIAMIATHNPLALFCAVPHFRRSTTPGRTAILDALKTWLNNNSVEARQDSYLRWEAVRVLADAEGPDVRPLIAYFDDNSWNALRARYRNGDLMGGIGLCLQIEPGVNVAGHDAFLDHVKTRFGANLVRALAEILSKAQISESIRIGALRLAGHIGEPALADAIRTCWQNHSGHNEHLEEYLWACAQCVDADPSTLLGPVCSAWAALPSESEDDGMPSSRDNVAAHNLRWAFHKKLPVDATRYFIQRASNPDLRWPIAYMLHGVDQPDAVEFVVRELAKISERLEGTNGISPFLMSANDDWERRQKESGRAMSEVSRSRLLNIWQNPSVDKHLREQAFRLWAATHRSGDLDFLRSVSNAETLADKVLWRRLQLRDRDAIPALIAKLSTSEGEYWWQLGRYIWSNDLTKALDEALEKKETHRDWVLSEMVMRLPTSEADALLNKHWSHLCASQYYVIAALYVATPKLQARVADAIKAASDPKKLLDHLSTRFGYKMRGHPGLFRREQIEAVVPYLDLLAEMDIYHLWTACNEHGWYSLRRTHLDSRFPPTVRDWAYLNEVCAMDTLDGFLAKKSPWIDHWLDDFLKSGASLDDVMAIIGRWLGRKADIGSLQLASAAILHIGERRHLNLFGTNKIEPTEVAAAISANTEFGVRRRTLRV